MPSGSGGIGDGRYVLADEMVRDTHASSSRREVIIKAENLSVKYKDRNALDSISFEVYEGEIFALLGSNGAGKSTLLSCLCRENRNYTGSLTIGGYEVKKNRAVVLAQVAFVPQEYSFFFDFTVHENLRFAALMFNIPKEEREARINAMLEEYNLDKFAKVRAKNLSGGYKRLLNIAISVIKDPKIVLLDEPTAGLDVSMRQLINNTIRKFKSRGVSVILTTHYLEDVEEVCDRAVLLTLGKVLAIGPLEELIRAQGGPYVIILSEISGDVKQLFKRAAGLEHFTKVVPLDDRIYFLAPQENITECLHEVSALLSMKNVSIGKIAIREPSLNKVFLGAFGGGKSEGTP